MSSLRVRTTNRAGVRSARRQQDDAGAHQPSEQRHQVHADEGRIVVQIEPGPDCVRIQVVDEGVGIPNAIQPYLFERFTKARPPGLRGELTTGLSLVLCKTIVDWHHGQLAVASIKGKGTTFTIELPRAAA